jgi:hypothetical protein
MLKAETLGGRARETSDALWAAGDLAAWRQAASDPGASTLPSATAYRLDVAGGCCTRRAASLQPGSGTPWWWSRDRPTAGRASVPCERSRFQISFLKPTPPASAIVAVLDSGRGTTSAGLADQDASAWWPAAAGRAGNGSRRPSGPGGSTAGPFHFHLLHDGAPTRACTPAPSTPRRTSAFHRDNGQVTRTAGPVSG